MKLWNYLATPDTRATNPTVTTIIVKILEKYADHLCGFPRKGARTDFRGKSPWGSMFPFEFFELF
jgi:hypothetical protein